MTGAPLPYLTPINPQNDVILQQGVILSAAKDPRISLGVPQQPEETA